MKILPDDHKSLRTHCEPVTHGEIVSGRWDNEITTMIALMVEAQGMGLSANQVGIHKRFFVWDNGDPMTFRFGVFYNPRWEPSEMERNYSTDEEMCLSLLKPRKIRRPFKIKAIWTNANGVEVDMILTGLHARCFMHECDHLNGIPFSQMTGV